MGSTSGGNIVKSIVLNTERHAHLIRFIEKWQAENSGSLSTLFRTALELFIERQEIESRQESVTVAEIEAACRRAVEQALKGRVVEVGSDDSGLMTQSSEEAETQTKGQLAKMRDALEEWE